VKDASHTTRLDAALAGRYRIEKKLGEGGMASVYLAEDVKHERKVALKILRPELAAVIGAERFLAEIKTTANLQHPHILALFDSGEADGFLYYVMPYVEGETLRDRLDREGQLGVEEAVRIAREVADALDYAHRAGVIHRDIKPANILLHDGRPVVADFGIALAISAAGGGRMTETGLSLGTPHYMSPEQASADRDLSARSDVYSLGCVLYEMLAGQPPHTGPSAQSILVRILTEDPRPLTELRHTVPPHVAATVMKSIEKLPADRFESAREFKDALSDASFAYEVATRTRVGDAPRGSPRAAATSSTGWTTQARVLAATTAVFALTTVLTLSRIGDDGAGAFQTPTMSFELLRLPGGVPAVAINDRGDVVTTFFVRADQFLRLRAAGADSFAPLPGTEGAGIPVFSPDGEWVAFSRSNSAPQGVFKVSLSSGVVVPLYESGGTPTSQSLGFQPTGLAWGDDGFIYTSPRGPGATIARIHEDGGAPDTVLHLPDGFELRPQDVLPGGGTVLAMAAGEGSFSDAHAVTVDVATGDTTSVAQGAVLARWSETGHIIYANGSGGLFAVPFDVDALRPTGPPALAWAGLAVTGRGGLSSFDLSASGLLVFVRGGDGSAVPQGFDLGWLGTTGFTRLPIEPVRHPDPDLSEDGSKLVYLRGSEVVVFDLDLGTQLSFGQDGSDLHNPVLSPDGDRVAVFGTFADTAGLWLLSGSAGASRRLLNVGRDEGWLAPAQWLDDATLLSGTLEGGDVYTADIASGEARPILTAAWAEAMPRVSPDRRWLAFGADEDGTARLYVRSWPGLRDKVLVSQGDEPVLFGIPGNRLVWSPDSRQIFYQQGGELMVATLDTDGGSQVWSNARTGLELPEFAFVWDRHPVTGEILVVQLPEQPEARSRSIVLVTNWFEVVRTRLAEGG
jgi:serine/threonine-protein kinase